MKQKGMFDSEVMEKDGPDWEGMTETDTATRAHLSAERWAEKHDEMQAAFRDLVSTIQHELAELKRH